MKSFAKTSVGIALRERSWLRRLFIICIAAPILAWVAVLIAPACTPSLEPRARVRCQSNMRQIGLAMMMYANEHGGKYPESLHEILATQDLTPDVFVCPMSANVIASDPTTRAVLEDFDQPGHSSYFYLGKGLTDQADPKSIVLYEPLPLHESGMNVLFADYHVEFIDPARAHAFLRSIAGGGPAIVK